MKGTLQPCSVQTASVALSIQHSRLLAHVILCYTKAGPASSVKISQYDVTPVHGRPGNSRKCGCSDCKASEVEQHLRKCPSRKQNRRRNQKAYIQPDCNMSAVALDQSTNAPAKPAPLNTTESRTAYAAAIGDDRLRQLVNKMRSIAQKVCFCV